jgi:hypothetical protein
MALISMVGLYISNDLLMQLSQTDDVAFATLDVYIKH